MTLRARLGLLADHDFRQLFSADTSSQIGSQVGQLALPLIAVIALNASALEVGLLSAAATAAFLIVGLPAGAWVDRMRRRSVLMAGDLVRAVLLLSIPLAWWQGWLTIGQLYVVALGQGVATVFFDVAYQSYLPHLVGRDNLVEGNAKLQAVEGVTSLAGPGIAGVLIQWFTAPYAMLLNGLTYLGSAAFVSRIRSRETKPERGPDAHLGREIVEGVRFVMGNPLLRRIAACTGSSNLFSSIMNAMVLVLLARKLHASAGVIGLLFSIASVGGLIGALTATRFAKWLGQGPVIWISIAVASPFGLLVPLAGHGILLGLVAIGDFVTFAGSVIYNINQVSFRQRLAPDHLLGRMNATMRFLVWGTLPLGGLIGGILGQQIGIRPTIWVGAIGQLFAFLPVFLSPLRTMRELPTEPADVPEQGGPAGEQEPAGATAAP